MKFSLDNGSGGYAIRRYANGAITVAYPPDQAGPNVIDIGGRIERPRMIEEELRASFIIAPALLIRDWGPGGFEGLTDAHLAQLAGLGVEIVLLGTGARARFPSPASLRTFAENGVGVEVMDSGAACRTYGVLVAEGRKVAAGIIIG
jgi:uncharacterized protein